MPALAQTFPRPVRAVELQEVLRAEAAGSPFVVYRDDEDRLQILCLAEGLRCTIGRRRTNDIALPWDWQVSRVHAELERIGDCWAVTDDGLSTNGTFVNGAQITARRRLADGDSVRVGESVLVFREPTRPSTDAFPTEPSAIPLAPQLSVTQRRVLVALCRPCKDSDRFASPATNQQIAAEVFLSVDRVKAHLRVLFDKFALGHLPQNRKRLELVERALRSGLITSADL